MNNWKATLLTPLLVISVCFINAQAQSDWSQWGGPTRDFTAKSKGLAATWPATGPRQLWSRPLGAGHSAVVVSGNTLYTMYSVGEEETVIALAADSGKTVWEHKYPSPHAGLDYEYGVGPHSTPLLVGDLLFTVGSRGVLHAIDKKSGKVAWSHDLWKDFWRFKVWTRLLLQSDRLQKHDHPYARWYRTNVDRFQSERWERCVEESNT